MKKVITFLIIFLFLAISILVKVEASDEEYLNEAYMEIGVFEGNVLKMDGYTLVDSNINKDVIGDYLVKYKEDSTGRIVKRIIHVVTKEMLTKGINAIKELETGDTYTPYVNDIIISSLKINEYTITTGNRYYGTAQYQHRLNDCKGFFYIYKEGKRIVSYAFDEYSYISKIERSDNGFFLFMTIEDYSTVYLLLREYDLEGNMLREININGNKLEFSYDMYTDLDYIYLFFTSSSIDLQYKIKYSGAQNGFIAKINKEDLSIVNYYCFGDNIDTEIRNVWFYKDKVYVLTFERGKNGDIFNNNFYLTSYDDCLNLEYRRKVSALNAIGYFIMNDKLVISRKELNDEKIYFDTYDSEYLSFVKTYTFEYSDDDYTINKIVGNKDSNSIVISVNGKSVDDKVYHLGFIDMNYNFIEFKNVDLIIANSIEIDDNIYFIGSINNRYIELEYKFIKANIKEKYYVLNKSYNTYDLIYNKKEKNKKVIYDSFNDEKVYGDHFKIVCFQCDNISVFLKDEYYIELNCNIRDKESYEKDTAISFNGTCYLNGKLIENGYRVTENGSYTLTIYGRNSVSTNINFQILDIAKKASEKENRHIDLKIKDVVAPIVDIKKETLIHAQVSNIEEVDNVSSFAQGVVTFSLFGLVGLFFPVNIKKRSRK